MSRVITKRRVRRASSSPSSSPSLYDHKGNISPLNKHTRATTSTSGYLNDNSIIGDINIDNVTTTAATAKKREKEDRKIKLQAEIFMLTQIMCDNTLNDTEQSVNNETYISPFKSEEIDKEDVNTMVINIIVDNTSHSVNDNKKYTVRRERKKRARGRSHSRMPTLILPPSTTLSPHNSNNVNTKNDDNNREKKVNDNLHVLKTTNHPISSIKPINIKKAMEIQQNELEYSSSSFISSSFDDNKDDDIDMKDGTSSRDSCSYPTINVRKRKNKGKNVEGEEEEEKGDVLNNNNNNNNDNTVKTIPPYLIKFQSKSLPTTPTDTQIQFLSSSSSTHDQPSPPPPTAKKSPSSTSLLTGLTKRITTSIKSSPRNCSNIVKKISKSTLRRSKSDKHTVCDENTTQRMDRREYYRRFYQEPRRTPTVTSMTIGHDANTIEVQSSLIGHHANTIEENSPSISCVTSSSNTT